VSGSSARVGTIGPGGSRLAHLDRRDALLDAAAELLVRGDPEDVSMESVAERAGVSRPLVYKHFANRQALLSALYEREAAHIHNQVVAGVLAETSLADMLRALIRGLLGAQVSREWTFATLASGGGRTPRQRQIQRGRDRQTVMFFARQATLEFDLPESTATAAIALALASVTTVMARWHHDPTPEHAALLEDVYVNMAVGGLRQLMDSRKTPRNHRSSPTLGS
jgi:AcrR family transcriptional regulator